MPSAPKMEAELTCLSHAMMCDCETFQVASVPGPGLAGDAGLFDRDWIGHGKLG